MGFGDEIMASGLARGAAKNGKLIAFGDGKRIIWSPQSHQIFQNNPNVVRPGFGIPTGVKWVHYYTGNRFYGSVEDGKWKFKDWSPPKGEIFFSYKEKQFGLKVHGSRPFVVIEPRVKSFGACAGANKQWPIERYDAVARYFEKLGIRVIQLVPSGLHKILYDVEEIKTPDFRSALAVLSQAILYIGPEGGLHHGAAAVGTNGVVIFGGFNSPKSTGYEWHENISVGEPCGNIQYCLHCKEAMESISIERVLHSVEKLMKYSELNDVSLPVKTGS